ncbi:MAG: glycoside hydrolase family 88 protein [Nannocystaceae bacterium]|nr:glycoside hydrolase family 88 protein [Nannocystaceae bacterium]
MNPSFPPPPLAIGSALAESLLRRRPPHTLPWRWDASMAMVGLGHLMDASPSLRDRHLGALEEYQSRHLTAPSISLSDQCLGAQTSVRLLSWTECTEARFASARVTRYLRSAPENSHGVLEHLGRHAWVRHLVRPGVWVDSMMMYVVTAAQLGALTQQPWLTRMAARHAEAFCAHLQSRCGLFRHARLSPDRRAPVHWLRGNGWAAVCLVELLDVAPGLRAAFERQANVLLDRQCKSGLWPTIVDTPTSPSETSGTALVAYALALGARRGWLASGAREAAWRAWKGLCSRLVSSRFGTTLSGISTPIIPAPAVAYRWAPRLSGLNYGVGAMMMLAAELARDVSSGSPT